MPQCTKVRKKCNLEKQHRILPLFRMVRNSLVRSSGGTPGTRNQVLETRNNSKNGFEGKLNMAFFHFLPYLMIFLSGSCQRHCRTLKNHQIWQNLAKNEENHCPTYVKIQHNSQLISGTWIHH